MANRAARSFLAGTGLVLVVTALACSRPDPGPSADGPEAVSAHGTVTVEWSRDLPAALDRARSEGKPVLVNFYADWCVWCKRLESTTLRDAQVAGLLRERVVPVSLDVDGDGRDLSARYGVEGLPTILVLSPDGREIGRIPGYMPPSGFLERIQELIGPAASV